MMLFQVNSPDLFTLAMYTITWVRMLMRSCEDDDRQVLVTFMIAMLVVLVLEISCDWDPHWEIIL